MPNFRDSSLTLRALGRIAHNIASVAPRARYLDEKSSESAGRDEVGVDVVTDRTPLSPGDSLDGIAEGQCGLGRIR
jgi:hypothetical protein